MRTIFTGGVVLVLAGAGFFAGLGVGAASDRDEAVITVRVSSAEHEAQEGYFTLGEGATLMVKPGSAVYRFLARHRGRNVRITFTDASRPEFSPLER